MNTIEFKKLNEYTSPAMELVELKPEKGFAGSIDENGIIDSLNEGYDC